MEEIFTFNNMKNKKGYYSACVCVFWGGFKTEILSSHYSTTQNPFTFLTKPPGGSTTTLIFYTRTETKRGEWMHVNPKSSPHTARFTFSAAGWAVLTLIIRNKRKHTIITPCI